MTSTQIPNHHGDHPGFSGVTGLLAAMSMIKGRGGDARLAARLTELTADDVVVDIGCGPGTAVRHAARVGATVIGVDPAAVMRRVARVLSTRARRIRFVDSAAEAIPLDDASASVAWSLATVHHWPDVEAGLHEVRRVLRPGGRFLAIERRIQPNAQGLASHGWADGQPEAFAARCEADGFEDVRVEQHTTERGTMWCVLARTPRPPADRSTL